MCVTSYTTGSKIGQKQSLMKKLIVLGLAFMTVSYAALSFIENLVLFISVLVLSSIGSGLVLPCVNSFITGAVGKERRGFVTSLYGSVRFLGVAIGRSDFRPPDAMVQTRHVFKHRGIDSRCRDSCDDAHPCEAKQ